MSIVAIFFWTYISTVFAPLSLPRLVTYASICKMLIYTSAIVETSSLNAIINTDITCISFPARLAYALVGCRICLKKYNLLDKKLKRLFSTYKLNHLLLVFFLNKLSNKKLIFVNLKIFEC